MRQPGYDVAHSQSLYEPAWQRPSRCGELRDPSLLPLALLPRRFTFSGPIYPDPEIRFSSCGSVSAFLFHKWRECYPLQASRFPGSPEGDRSDRVPVSTRPPSGFNAMADLPRERGNAKEAGRNTLSVAVSSSCECTQCWCRAFRSMFFFIAVVCPCAPYDYLPIFLRGPLRAACIRTACCVVNMNMAPSST